MGSQEPAQQSLSLLHESPAPAQLPPPLQPVDVGVQTPGPPGVDVEGQQVSPLLQAFCVPVVHGEPAIPAALTLQPTEEEVQMPGPPGVLVVAQQTSDESPQAVLVPVVQGQPRAGRETSVQ